MAEDTHVKESLFSSHAWIPLPPAVSEARLQSAQPILAASQVEQGFELESQHLCKDDHLCDCLCNYVL